MKHLCNLLTFCILLLSIPLQAQIACFPYTENFDNMTTCGVICGNPCILSNGWENSLADDFDWTVNEGATGSNNTGPSGDHTTGTGNYIYTETSGSCNNSEAIFISPAIDVSGINNLSLDFWYHMFGAAVGTLFVEVSTDNQVSWIPLDSFTDNLDAWQQRSIDLTAYTTGTIIFIRFRGATGSTLTGDMALDDITFSTPFTNNIGVSAIDNPPVSITVGSNPVEVTLSNLGSSTVTTANINWSVNGILQTPVAWTGSLVMGTSATQSLGSFNFSAGTSIIRAWSDSPNGLADEQVCNDTTEISVCTGLVGTYTVGTPVSDFTSLPELADVLNSCGVAGPVTIQVQPGTYTDRLILNEIPRSSSVNTVIIDGGSTSTTRLENTTLSNIYLNGSDWVTITNMTLSNTATTSGYGVQLANDARNNTISNCYIEMPLQNNLSNDVIGISASAAESTASGQGQNAFFTTVDNCHIVGGRTGIRFTGQSGSRNTHNTFTNNFIDQAELYGIYTDNQDFPIISGNTVQNLRATTADGFFLIDVMMFTVTENKVIAAPDYGIYLIDGNFDATPTARGQIINNMFSSTNDAAIYIDDIEETDIWHNTAYSAGGSTGALRVNDMVDLNIQNNIFVSETDFAFESSDATTIGGNTIDYNLYWTPTSNPNFIRDGTNIYADLAAWQAGVGTFNANSVEADPVFIDGVNDLHVLSAPANDVGNNSLGVLIDIDGEIRPAGPSVDIGADEFTLATSDVALRDLFVETEILCGSVTTPVSIVLENLGNNTITNLEVNVEVSGTPSQTLNFSYNGPLAFGELDTVVVGQANTATGGVFTFSASVTLSGDENTNNNSISSGFSRDFIPFLPQASDVNVCGIDTAYLIANTDYPVTYQWYDAPTGGNLVSGDTSFLVPSIAAQPTYYLEYNGVGGALTTTFAGGNASRGIMFDLTTTYSVTVTAFDIIVNSTSLANDVAVYYIPNSNFVTNATNPAPWILEDFYTISVTGTINPSKLTLSTGIPLVAGEFTAVYILLSSTIVYTDGTSLSDTFTDGIVTCSGGYGRGPGSTNSFDGPIFQPRNFNGTIYYQGTPCSSTRNAVTAITIPSEVSVSVALSQTQEDSGNSTFRFTFTRQTTPECLAELPVKFTVSGDAIWNQDYYLVRGSTDFDGTTGTVTIPDGQTSIDLVFQVQQDAINENDETIIVTIDNP